MRLRLVYHGTAWGEEILVVGSDAALGSWDVASGVPLEYEGEGVWSVDVHGSPAKLGPALVSYKYVVRDRDGSLRWEQCSDRVVFVTPYTLCWDRWNCPSGDRLSLVLADAPLSGSLAVHLEACALVGGAEGWHTLWMHRVEGTEIWRLDISYCQGAVGDGRHAGSGAHYKYATVATDDPKAAPPPHTWTWETIEDRVLPVQGEVPPASVCCDRWNAAQPHHVQLCLEGAPEGGQMGVVGDVSVLGLWRPRDVILLHHRRDGPWVLDLWIDAPRLASASYKYVHFPVDDGHVTLAPSWEQDSNRTLCAPWDNLAIRDTWNQAAAGTALVHLQLRQPHQHSAPRTWEGAHVTTDMSGLPLRDTLEVGGARVLHQTLEVAAGCPLVCTLEEHDAAGALVHDAALNVPIGETRHTYVCGPWPLGVTALRHVRFRLAGVGAVLPTHLVVLCANAAAAGAWDPARGLHLHQLPGSDVWAVDFWADEPTLSSMQYKYAVVHKHNASDAMWETCDSRALSGLVLDAVREDTWNGADVKASVTVDMGGRVEYNHRVALYLDASSDDSSLGAARHPLQPCDESRRYWTVALSVARGTLVRYHYDVERELRNGMPLSATGIWEDHVTGRTLEVGTDSVSVFDAWSPRSAQRGTVHFVLSVVDAPLLAAAVAAGDAAVSLSGSLSAFGQWDPQRAIHMRYDPAAHAFRVALSLAHEDMCSLEYKYVIVNDARPTASVWEERGNRTLALGLYDTVHTHDHWTHDLTPAVNARLREEHASIGASVAMSFPGAESDLVVPTKIVFNHASPIASAHARSECVSVVGSFTPTPWQHPIPMVRNEQEKGCVFSVRIGLAPGAHEIAFIVTSSAGADAADRADASAQPRVLSYLPVRYQKERGHMCNVLVVEDETATQIEYPPPRPEIVAPPVWSLNEDLAIIKAKEKLQARIHGSDIINTLVSRNAFAFSMTESLGDLGLEGIIDHIGDPAYVATITKEHRQSNAILMQELLNTQFSQVRAILHDRPPILPAGLQQSYASTSDNYIVVNGRRWYFWTKEQTDQHYDQTGRISLGLRRVLSESYHVDVESPEAGLFSPRSGASSSSSGEYSDDDDSDGIPYLD